jgi:hypothetical protein
MASCAPNLSEPSRHCPESVVPCPSIDAGHQLALELTLGGAMAHALAGTSVPPSAEEPAPRPPTICRGGECETVPQPVVEWARSRIDDRDLCGGLERGGECGHERQSGGFIQLPEHRWYTDYSNVRRDSMMHRVHLRQCRGTPFALRGCPGRACRRRPRGRRWASCRLRPSPPTPGSRE